MEYFKKTNELVSDEIVKCFMLNLSFCDEQKQNQFANWLNDIIIEISNQFAKYIECLHFTETNDHPNSSESINQWVTLIYAKPQLISNYLECDTTDIENNWKTKFIEVFGSDKEYQLLFQYKMNKNNVINKVLTGSSKIINSVGNDLTSMSTGIIGVTKNTVNTVGTNLPKPNIPSIPVIPNIPKIPKPSINLFEKKN